MKNKKRINLFAIVIFIVWSISVVCSVLYNIQNVTNKQQNLALVHAKNAFEKDMMFRRWIAMHGGVYVFPTKKTPPNPYLKHIPNRDLTTTTGEKLTLMNPAYALKELMHNFAGMYGEKGRITSLKLLNPQNKADKWETKVLTYFEEKKFTQFHEFYNYKGQDTLRYMKALTVSPNCLKCHVHQGYKVGDTRGGVSITIPMRKYNNDGLIEKENIVYLHLLIYIVGCIIGLIIYKRNIISINKEIKLEEELHQKEEMLHHQSKMASMGEMLENIAHQWRQPLSVISTASSGMIMQKEYGILTEEDEINSLNTITDSAQHLSKTIDDFRDFFNPRKERTTFNVKDTYNKTIALLESKFKNRSIEVIENIEDVDIYGLDSELVQVIMNILNNARDILEMKEKYSRRLIFIDIYKKSDNLIIKIKDNGGGIPSEIINRIFEPYFTTKHQSQGTGIGLYMTEEMVKKHMNGNVSAENVNYSYESESFVGACFTITLPISEE